MAKVEQMSGESSQELKFDLTDLYMTAPAFTRAGGALGDAAQQATSQLEGLGSFWGNDAPGQKFGASYQPYQDRLLQLLALVSGDVEGIADGINQMADEYKITEESNIAKIRAMNQEMP
jgi:hypothetical protein